MYKTLWGMRDLTAALAHLSKHARYAFTKQNMYPFERNNRIVASPAQAPIGEPSDI